MSLNALNWAFKLPITPAGKKLVLIALANWAIEDNTAWPGHQTLADITGQARSTVRKYLDELEADGFIRRVNRYSEGNGQQITNQYELIINRGVPSPGRGGAATRQGGVPPHGTNTFSNTRLLDTGASPIFDSFPPAKEKQSSAPSVLSILKEKALAIYTELRPSNWVDHKKPPRDAEPALREALAYADGDVDAAAEVIRDALTLAANDPWWSDPTRTLSMANILAKGRVTTFAEKRRALVNSDAKTDVALYDLTTGNPREKVREISKRVSHTRDATEEEWYWADDDSKGRFIRPGRVYWVEHVGTPDSPSYSGYAEVLRVEVIYAVVVTPDNTELRVRVSELGRESYGRERLGGGNGDAVAGGEQAAGGRGGGSTIPLPGSFLPAGKLQGRQ